MQPRHDPEVPFMDYGSDKLGSLDCDLVEDTIVPLLPNEPADDDY
jgi:hypothetical protein